MSTGNTPEPIKMNSKYRKKPQGSLEAPLFPGKKPYKSPVVKEYGDMREITLGTSPGIGESGNPNFKEGI